MDTETRTALETIARKVEVMDQETRTALETIVDYLEDERDDYMCRMNTQAGFEPTNRLLAYIDDGVMFKHGTAEALGLRRRRRAL